MPLELALREAKAAIFSRQITAGMVGGQQQAEAEIAVDLIDGGKGRIT
jgi:hypothetical protein